MSLKPGAGQELRKGRDALLAWHLNSPRRSAWRGGPAPITMDTGGTGYLSELRGEVFPGFPMLERASCLEGGKMQRSYAVT